MSLLFLWNSFTSLGVLVDGIVVGGLFVFLFLRSYGVVLLVSLAFVQGGLAHSLAFVRGRIG